MKSEKKIHVTLPIFLCVAFAACIITIVANALIYDFLGGFVYVVGALSFLPLLWAVILFAVMLSKKKASSPNDEEKRSEIDIRDDVMKVRAEIERFQKELAVTDEELKKFISMVKAPHNDDKKISPEELHLYDTRISMLETRRDALKNRIRNLEGKLFFMTRIEESSKFMSMSYSLSDMSISNMSMKSGDGGGLPGLFLSYKNDETKSLYREHLDKKMKDIWDEPDPDLSNNDEIEFPPELNISSFDEASNQKAPTVRDVEFSALSPRSVEKGEYAIIEIVAYEDSHRAIVDKMLENSGSETKETVASSQNVADGTMIKVVLTSPNLDLSGCEEEQKWSGRHLVFSFPIEIPADFSGKQILFIAKVYFDDVIATKLNFVVKCTADQSQKIDVKRQDISSVFMSYASDDRGKVISIVQGIKKARPDLDVFLDVDSLRSGDNWRESIKSEIKRTDLLYLCWSLSAKKSIYVEEEWKYALDVKGIDCIEPIPLVPPTVCPPPKELETKHFNDRLIYLTFKQ